MMRKIIAAAIHKNGKILLAKRNYGSLSGYWEFPGGKVEGDETDIQCIEREIKEEFSAKIQVESLLGSIPFQVEDHQYKMVLYGAALLTEIIQLNAHSEIAWVAREQLKEYKLAPADELLVQTGCLEGLA